MKPDFRKCMIWLHTYSGLVIGWLLFFIFVTGTLSYFTPEITRWMKPELEVIELSETQMINRSVVYLNEHAQDANYWRIYLPTTRDYNWYVQWQKEGRRVRKGFDPQGAVRTQDTETKGGLFFRNLHYTLHLRGYGGRYIAGIAAAGMLIAIFTGIYTHRRFFKDFFTLRTKNLWKLITDFHALAGIVTLPFYIMLSVSAIVIYAIMYMPWAANYYFENGERGVSRENSPPLPVLSQQAKKVESNINFPKIQQYLSQQWIGENQIRRIIIDKPGYENSRLTVERTKETTVSNRSDRIVFSTYSGDLQQGYIEPSLAAKIRRVFYGLHQGLFADIFLRWVFFILGILGTALIATGQLIWCHQRTKKWKNSSEKQPPKSYLFVAKTNVAVFMGLFVAIFAFFIANRLFSLEMESRTTAEIKVFFFVWLAMAVHALIRPSALAWREQSLLATIAVVGLILIEMCCFGEHIVTAYNASDSSYFSIFMAFCFAALILLWTTYKLYKKGD